MKRQLIPAAAVLVVLTVLCGLVYPLVVTGVAQATMNGAANGSLVRSDGKVVGSSLLGQNFTEHKYFWPRPSAAGEGYDGMASAASNLGPSSQELVDLVAKRAAAYRTANGLAQDALVPVDAVTASGSGLDPDISVANARLQAARVASVRGLTTAEVRTLIDRVAHGRTLGVLGEPGVNVLELNLALDRLS